MAKKTKEELPADMPSYDELMWPVIETLKEFGGAATTQDLLDRVSERMKLSEATRTFRKEGKSRDELLYRSDWTKWYLRKAGVVDYQDKLWSLLPKGRTISREQVKEIPALVKKMKSGAETEETVEPGTSAESQEETAADHWRSELLTVLQTMDFTAFERLCKAILIKSGFEKVLVTQASNDKGIDGKGILRLNLISFRVLFQCKRYKDSVQGPEIRNFQAAMSGRADKGLFITTGRFSKGAEAEAGRDGAMPVELINGEMLCDILKKLEIGVETKLVQVESVTIDKSFFDKI